MNIFKSLENYVLLYNSLSIFWSFSPLASTIIRCAEKFNRIKKNKWSMISNEEINTRMLINKWTKFVSFLLVRLKKAEGDRRGQEGARSRSHSTKTKTETESRRSGTVTWRAASEDAVSCEGRGDRSWRRNARTRHTWRVSRQYAFDSDELIRRFWRIAIRILATDTGTVFHLERKKKCYNAYTRCFVTFTGDTRESVTFPFLEYDSKAMS